MLVEFEAKTTGERVRNMFHDRRGPRPSTSNGRKSEENT